jgi:glycosyltransferase involved in cell wall biosynthesis
VQSILNQTFTNFELIVIDDGSTDGTKSILEELRENDSRIIVISRENRGLVVSLNEGIDLACGKWIARMDADDIALPNRFERQLQCLEETGADICGSWVKVFGNDDDRIIKCSQSDDAIKMELLFGTPFAHPTVLMKTELVRGLRYDKAWEKCEDYDLWERAAQRNWKMANVPEVLLMYRIHENQISTVTLSVQMELTRKVRHRYWRFIAGSLKLNDDSIEEVLKLREPYPPRVNMARIDSLFLTLLERSSGEAREIIFEHMTRLYFRAAAKNFDVAFRWTELNKKYGAGYRLGIKLQLLFLSFFRVSAESRLFVRLKKFYF